MTELGRIGSVVVSMPAPDFISGLTKHFGHVEKTLRVLARADDLLAEVLPPAEQPEPDDDDERKDSEP